MKKNGILNSHISTILSNMGHTDMLTIADCGLPIPSEVNKIDLALKIGIPSFLETLKTVVSDMEIEKITLANEIKKENPILHEELLKMFESIDYVSHENFKKMTNNSKAIIRTGEATPYANIILHAGVIF